MEATMTPPHTPPERHLEQGVEADGAALPHSQSEQSLEEGVDADIRAPYEDDTVDSALGADDVSDTESIKSMAYEYLKEHGHTYHNGGKWLIPNDEVEQDRMDLLHHAFKVLFRGSLLVSAERLPSEIHRVLDVGTGTGIWAIEMADQHPGAEIVGTDLSPIQPNWVPPNCRFMIDNAEEPWASKLFDVVHFRCMEGAFRNWPEIYRQAYQHMSPDGLIEVVAQDLWTYRDDGPVPKIIVSWMTDYNDAMQRHGYPTRIAHKHEEWIQNAGFVDVSKKEFIVPLGHWAKDPRLKEAGYFYLASVLGAVDTYSTKLFVDHLGRKPQEVTIMKGQLYKEFANMTYHLYTKVLVVSGSKSKQGV